MASLFWSWIFIFSLIRPGLALVVTEVLAQRAAAVHTTHSLTKAEKSRNTFIALAVAFTVVIIAIIAGIVALILRSKNKVADAETAAVPAAQVEKPHWFMVDSKKNWWPMNLGLRPATPREQEEHPDGLHSARLRAALNKMAGRSGKPILPTHNDKRDLPSIPEPSPRYPDILERGYRAPIYPTTEVPALTRTMYEGDKPQPRSPPKAIVTQGLSRAFARHDRRGMPRSPAGRRKSWLTRGAHPFIPLKENAQVLSAPKTAAVDAPSLTHKFTMSKPRVAPKPPTTAPLLAPPSPPKNKRVPPPLRLEEQFERRVRFGLPSSPRTGLPTSPRPRHRAESPAF
jgi:hypothetical protein